MTSLSLTKIMHVSHMNVHLLNIQNMCQFYLNPKKWIKNKK